MSIIDNEDPEIELDTVLNNIKQDSISELIKEDEIELINILNYYKILSIMDT